MSRAQVDITDNDREAQPGFVEVVADSLRVREDAGSVSVGFRRVGGSDGALQRDVFTTSDDGSEWATPGEDYQETKADLRWDNGESGTKFINVPIIDDDRREGDEIFLVVLNDAQCDCDTTTEVTIENVNPQFGTVQFRTDSVSVKESDDEATLTVERVSGSEGVVSVSYRTGGSTDTATADEDYTSTSGTLRWSDGDSAAKRISVPLLEDTLREESETFSVQLFEVGGGAALGNRSQAQVRIEDSTNFGALEFRSRTQNATEDQGTVRLAVRRVGGSAGAVSVRYTVGASADSATKGTDYTGDNGVLNWANGDTSDKQIELRLLTDAVAEDNETITVTLSQPGGNANLGDNTSTRLTVADATSFGSFRFTDDSFTVKESDGSVNVAVSRNGGTDGAVSVQVSSGAEGDTAIAGADYTAIQQTLSWNAGEGGEKTVSLQVLEDDELEELEFLTLTLRNAEGGAGIGSPSSASVDIENTTLPEFGAISFVEASPSYFESAGTVQLRLQRIGGVDGPVSVDYQIGTASDTATQGEDYTTAQTSGTISWADQDNAEKTIELTLVQDNVREADEQVSLSLSNPQGGATLGGNATASLTILDESGDPLIPTLDIISGNQQSGFPGNVLEPFVISVASGEDPAPGASVSWRVEPADAGRLIDGSTTTANDSSQAQNRLEILKGGVITITATADAPGNANTAQSRAEDTPNEAVFTVNAGFEGVADLTPNQQKVGKSLDSACAALRAEQDLSAAQQDLLRTCDTLEQSTTEQIRLGIDRLSPEEAFAIGTASLDVSDIQVTNVQARINAIRAGADGIDLSGLDTSIYDQQIPGYVLDAAGKQLTGGAGGDAYGSKLGVFVNGSIAFGKLDESEREKGLDFDTRGITIGADYRTDNNWVYGGAVGLVTHEGDYSAEDGNLEMSGTSLSAFATWYDEDEAYFDAIISFGQSDFDVKRRINLANEAEQFALSSPSASELSISIGAGLDYNNDNWQYGPYGRISHTQVSVDSYTESVSNPNAAGTGSVLSVEDQSLDSSVLVLGGQVSKTISMRRGVLIPQARLELEHKLDDKHRELDAYFVHDPSKTGFTIESDEVDTDYFNVGTGVSAVFANGKSGYLFYETRVGQDRVSQHWVKAGFRLEF